MNTTKNLSLEEQLSRLEKAVKAHNKKQGKPKTLLEWKKQAVDRFDLAAAHDMYVRQHHPDYDIHGSDGWVLMDKIWSMYREDRIALQTQFPKFFDQIGDEENFESFRSEVYP